MEKKEWRLVDMVGPVSRAESTTASMPPFIEKGEVPSTIVMFESCIPCITMGRHEDIDGVIDYQKARELGVVVYRRQPGGGTIWMPPYPGVALVMVYNMSKSDVKSADDMANLYIEVAKEIAKELKLPDIDIAGSGDVRHQGVRKVGSSSVDRFGTVYNSEGGGFFANRVSKFRYDLYLDIAKIPAAKFKDKAIKELSQYIAGVSDIAGREISRAEMKQAYTKSIEKVANVRLVEAELTLEEKEALAEAERIGYSEPWLFRKSSSRFRAKNKECKIGFAEEKYKKLVQFNVAVAPETNELKDVMISGDMYLSPPETVDDMEEALKGANATDKEELFQRIKAIMLRPGVESAAIHKITPEEYCSLLEKAIGVALQS